MSDITKARKFLNSRQSKLQHLPSFGLMYATALSNYKKYRLEPEYPPVKVGAILDYCGLVYLKHTNQLPKNISSVFQDGVSAEQKVKTALAWLDEVNS